MVSINMQQVCANSDINPVLGKSQFDSMNSALRYEINALVYYLGSGSG